MTFGVEVESKVCFETSVWFCAEGVVDLGLVVDLVKKVRIEDPDLSLESSSF